MSRSHRTIRNVLVTLGSQLLSWAMTFAVNLLLPRYTGAANLGILNFSLSFVGIFGVAVSLGTSTVLIKEVARNPERSSELLLTALVLRIPFSLLLCAIAVLTAWAVGWSPLVVKIVFIYGIGMTIVTISDIFYSILMGQERMTRQSAVALIEKALYSGGTIFAVGRKATLPVFAIIPQLSGLVSIFFGYSALRSLHLRFTRASMPSMAAIRALALAGLPFLGWDIFRTLYGQTDPIILKIVGGDEVVGWYSVAFKLMSTTLFFPNAIVMAILPVMSSLYTNGNDTREFKRLAQQILWLVVLTGTPIALILIVLSQPIIALLYKVSVFNGAIPALQVGGVGVLLYYVGSAIGTAVVAADGQAKMFRSSIAATCIAIPACFLGSWITQRLSGNGSIGAMWSDLAVELFMIVCYIRMLPAGTYAEPGVMGRYLRLAGAATPMAVVLLLGVRAHWGGVWIAIPAALLYVICCFLLRCIDRESISLLKGAVSKKAGG